MTTSPPARVSRRRVDVGSSAMSYNFSTYTRQFSYPRGNKRPLTKPVPRHSIAPNDSWSQIFTVTSATLTGYATESSVTRSSSMLCKQASCHVRVLIHCHVISRSACCASLKPSNDLVPNTYSAGPPSRLSTSSATSRVNLVQVPGSQRLFQQATSSLSTKEKRWDR